MPPPEWFTELAAKVNNWGRWGDDDELGTVNLVTDDVRRRAAACVKTGKAFSLAIPLSEDGPQMGFVKGRVNPTRTMIMINEPAFDPNGFASSDDVVTLGLQAATHWDALVHATYLGRLYNGYPPSSIDERGASKCGINTIKSLVSRGILLDVLRAKGVDKLDDGYCITGDDLDAAEELAGVKVESGDIVLVRTGHMQLLRARDKVGYAFPSPGPSRHSVQWLRDHDVAAIATDTFPFEALPGDDPEFMLPVHLLHLVEMGLLQGQNFDLEDLAADCADDGVYEFLLSASPEPFVGALGTPVNPVAIK
jgi:kynurenine formamidase